MFQQAIEIDHRYSMAYAALAWTYINDFLYGWTIFPDKSLQRAVDLAKKALHFENSNALAHSALGFIYVRRMQYDLAISELQRTIKLNPNDTQSQNVLGSVMLYTGRKEEAIFWKESALRLNPNSGRAIYMTLAQAYYLSGRYDDAIIVLKKGVAEQPNFVGNYIMLAAAYAQVGSTKEAKRSAAMVLHLQPFFEAQPYGTVFRDPEDRSKLIDGLKRAGLQ